MLDEQDFPVLVAQNGPLKGERWPLNGPVVIGRENACEITIPDRQVSRYHARISVGANGVILEDLGSKNGTHYRGGRLTAPVALQDGDTFQVAVAQEFLFLSSDATMPLESGPMHSGKLQLDMKSRQVWVDKKQMTPPLSALQFHLLWVLYENEGSVVTRQQLVSEVWGDEQAAGVTDQALDALIRRLRDRLAEMDPTNTYLTTVRGHGLRLDNPAG